MFALLFGALSLPVSAYVHSTENKEAMELYLTAQSEININADYKEGIRLLNQALGLDPNYYEALYALREGYNMLQDYPKVVEICTRIASSEGIDVQYKRKNRMILAHALFNSGDYARAKETFEAALPYATEDESFKIHKMIKKIKHAKEIRAQAYEVNFEFLDKLNTSAYNEVHPSLVVEKVLFYTLVIRPVWTIS